MDDASIPTGRRSPPAGFDVNKSYSIGDGRLQRALLTVPQAPPTTAVNSVPELQQIISAQKAKAAATTAAKNWQYRKERIIGAGADGKVYLATDLSSREHIAVKEILISTATNRTLKQAQEDAKKMGMMKKQIDWLRKLPANQNVVQHLGAERTTCALNVMMEYVAGGSISALLGKLGPFSEKVVRGYTRNICTALAFLHEAGVIHRDIKGANCLVGLDGTAKVADFGCCIIHSLATGANGQAEKPGIHGTSMWMSPECIQALPVTDRTDMWSLGCTVVEMATGKPPWAEAHFTNEWAAMFYISQAKRGPPIPPHLSRQAHDFLLQCFHVDPAKRLSAAECLLHPFLAHDFDPDSSARDMQPPTPTEAPPTFPRAPTSTASTADDASSTDDYATTSAYSTMTGAVYDPAWGDVEVNDDDLEEQYMDPTQHHTHTHAHSHPRGLGLGGQPGIVMGCSTEEEQAQAHQRQHSSPSNLGESLSEHRHSAVSQEAIDTYIRGAGSPANLLHTCGGDCLGAGGRGHDDGTPLAEDEHGFGLPEPVLYAVFAYLDHTALCQVGAVSRSVRDMVDHGAKEFLWRNLFLLHFGEVDRVRMTLRKQWKQYFQVSLFHQTLPLDEVQIVRQLCQSLHVFDGRDRRTDEPVVVKLERWSTQPTGLGVGGGGRRAHGAAVVPCGAAAPSHFTTALLNATLGSRDRDMSPIRQTDTRDRASLGTAGGTSSGSMVTSMSPGSRTPSKPLKVNPFTGASLSTVSPPAKPSMLVSALATAAAGGIVGVLAVHPFAHASGGGGSGGGGAAVPLPLSPPKRPSHAQTTVHAEVSPGGVGERGGPSSSSSIAVVAPTGTSVSPPSGSAAHPPAQPEHPHSAMAGGYGLPPTTPKGATALAHLHPLAVGAFSPSPGKQQQQQAQQAQQASSPKKPPMHPGQPHTAPPGVGVLHNGVQRGKILPRTKGLNTPTAISRVLATPTGGDQHTPSALPSGAGSGGVGGSDGAGGGGGGAGAHGRHQFVFLQPSQFMKELHAGGGGSSTSSTTPSKGSVGCDSSSSELSCLTGPRDQFGRTLSWAHDLYDFPRSSDLVPLVGAGKAQQRSLLQHSYKLLRHLEALGTRCIPRLLHYRDADANLACNVLVTAPVGPSLNELLTFCGNQLTLRSVCLLSLRLLDAVQDIHARDVVHAGITPTNIAIGVGESVNQIFLLNFSQGRFFRDPRTHRPIATLSTSATAEKARKQNEFLSFCSTFVQRKCTAAPRDDVIAIGYVLCYLFYGGLPWIKERQTLHSAEVVRQKMMYMDALQRAPPIQLHYFLKSGYTLRQGELPDYSYLRGLVKRLMQDRGWTDDGNFDWDAQLRDKSVAHPKPLCTLGVDDQREEAE